MTSSSTPQTGARSSRQTVGDERVLAATGRSRAEWFALLDEADAGTWTHTERARWLTDTHQVDDWWAQNVTVAYEQERGLRVPGQKADGTFAASISRTLPVSRETLTPWLVEDDRITAWAGEGTRLVSKAGAKIPKLHVGEGPRAALHVDDAPAKDGTPRTRLAVDVEKLESPEAVGEAKEQWAQALDRLRALL